MDSVTLIGFAAGFLTTIAFVPQVYRIWKTKSARDVSLVAFLAFTAGLGLWLAYGVMKQEPPIVVWNAVTLALALAIIVMKIRYKGESQ
jgi:MtN3 and saliva related transmembrane protein